MYFFFSLFACSPDSASSESPDAYAFTPDLLFIHELWLHPGDPVRPMNPRGDANVSIKLYGPHDPRTQSPDDVCSWYGNLSDSEVQSLNYPYGLKSRLRVTVQKNLPIRLMAATSHCKSNPSSVHRKTTLSASIAKRRRM